LAICWPAACRVRRGDHHQRPHAARADQAAQALVAQGFRAVGYAFDVTRAAQVEQAIARIEEEIGAIDILINNAGIQRRFPLPNFRRRSGITLLRSTRRAFSWFLSRWRNI
jgi:NAD(P)-dependent dehydrogenase (short-subunit alcohol dehydrogenase family)